MNAVNMNEDIAIVGMACLLPGARDYDAFWANIMAGKVFVSEASERWSNGKLDPDSPDLERIYTNQVGRLGALAEFDPLEFGVVPNAVPATEPDQLLALKLAAAALRDAGYHKREFDRTSAGVILGRGAAPNPSSATAFQYCLALDQTVEMIHQIAPQLDQNDLKKVRLALKNSLPPLVIEAMPGLVSNVAVGRIANRLDLQGPSYLIDAACSSTLIAVELAMKELRTGQSRMMLAGGVQASMPPQVYMLFCKLGALTRTGVRPFANDAAGTALSEGVGFLVLKRRSDAEADGDRIYAVLKSAGIASDGRAQGLLTPRLEGEVLAIRRAYDQSGIDPATVGLIEAHGTGIPVGDRTEVSAMKAVFGSERTVPRLAVGSVKSMIGHCIPAAGVASLIKTALALHYKILPPTRCETVNPDLALEDSPIYINNVARPWVHPVAGTPRRAGINGFGFGGINAHVVLEENPVPTEEEVSGYPWPVELILLSAATVPELQESARALIDRTTEEPNLSLATLSRQLASRPAGKCRLAVVASGPADLAAKLEGVLPKIADGRRMRLQTRTGVFFDLDSRKPEGKTAFVFPGQGSQYPNMFADVCMAFPAFRRQFDVSDTAYEGIWKHRASQYVFPPPTCLSANEAARLGEEYLSIDVATETVFTSGLAMFHLLDSLGLRSDIMVGHSTGEYTALVASGAVVASGAEEYQLRARLNRIYREVNTAASIPRGALLTVGAVETETFEGELAAYEGRIFVAIDNCPHQKIVFGSADDVESLAGRLKALGGVCQILPFNTAYHTPLLEPMKETLLRYYQELPVTAPKTRLFSCSSLAEFPSEPNAIREVATLQWYRSIRFREMITKLHEEENVRTFIEVGPSNHATSFVEDTLRKRDVLAVASNERTRSGLEQLLVLLGRLWCRGFEMNLAALYQQRMPGTFTDDPVEPKRAPSKANKPLDLDMPNMSLPAEIVREIRRTAGGNGASPPGAPAIAAAAPQHAPDAAAVPTADSHETILLAHEHLMQEFLAGQQRCLESLIEKAGASREN